MKYLPSIDGLRAFAVGVVVLFHAELGFTGGFIGVDVFFVISGFLITRLILRGLREGSFSVVGFWERRIRRILPALCFMVGAVLLAGWFLLLPPAYASLGASAVWQVFLVANVYFWRNTGYFAGAAEEMPLLHTWSLAVEEQFYLAVPVLLMACWCWHCHRRKAVILLLAGITIGSFAVSVYGVAFHQSAAFYLLPFRAWELALGSALAVLPESCFRVRPWLQEVLGWIGLSMILIAALTFDRNTPFPGFAALLPCIGTALVIWATAWRTGLLSGMLAWPPLVWVGLISYSLYLWHWPLFAIARSWALEPLAITDRLMLVVASVVLAFLSYRFVEQPFRRKQILGSRRNLFLGGAAASLVVLLSGFLISNSGGIPSRVDPATYAYSAAVEEMEFINEVDMAEVVAGALPKMGADSGQQRLLLWGDSHAMALAPAFDEALRVFGWGGRLATHSSTAPMAGFSRAAEYGLGSENLQFSAAVLDYVQAHGIKHVVLAAHWSAYPPRPVGDEIGNFDEQLVKTVEMLSSAGVKTWVVLGVPLHKASIPKVLLRRSVLGEDTKKHLDDPARDWNGISGADKSFVQTLQRTGATVIDPRPAFVDERGDSYLIELQGRPLYRDEQHLTPFAARKLIAPMIVQALEPFARLESSGSESGGRRSEVGHAIREDGDRR